MGMGISVRQESSGISNAWTERSGYLYMYWPNEKSVSVAGEGGPMYKFIRAFPTSAFYYKDTPTSMLGKSPLREDRIEDQYVESGISRQLQKE